MKRSDILTPIGMLLGIGLIVFAISQGNVGLAGFYDLVSVIITIGGSYAALLITFSLDEVKMMGTISKGLFKTPSMNKIDVINQFKEISIKSVFRYRHIYPLAIQAVAEGKVNLKGIVTNIFELDDIQNAMDRSVNEKADIVKSVVKIC